MHMLTPLRGESMPPFASLPILSSKWFLSAFGEFGDKMAPPFGRWAFSETS
jgi:hypothetical protein